MKQAISRQNDALQHEIQELYKELQNEKALHKMTNAGKESKDALSHQNDTLQQELRDSTKITKMQRSEVSSARIGQTMWTI